jgi:nucleotide-binding universal stress UspA family protein
MDETRTNEARQGVVVVGTDGSEASVPALRFAFEEGLRRGVGVEVVTGWVVTSPYTDDYGSVLMEETKKHAADAQERAVARALEGMSATPPISRTVVHGYGGTVLTEAAHDAAVLVVGHTQRGRLSRAFIGSVSAECLRSSSVPVIVVPDPHTVAHQTTHQEVVEAPASGASTT